MKEFLIEFRYKNINQKIATFENYIARDIKMLTEKLEKLYALCGSCLIDIKITPYETIPKEVK